ncbi:MAG: GspH/FimT family protein [Gammaproteobacteria bacterium]|nr:GspH/FimT family protein [Gammaproteobacteria bacterium]
MGLATYHINILRAHFGWSLLELLIVLALMAIVASMVTPGLYASWHLQSLHDERHRLAQQLHFARLTSLQRNSKVNVCWSATCGSPLGFAAYLDANSDGYFQADEEALSHWQLTKGLSLHFNRGEQIGFNAAGNTAQSGTFILCSSRAHLNEHKGLALVVSSSGRLREQISPCI